MRIPLILLSCKYVVLSFKIFLDILMKVYWYFIVILRLISLMTNANDIEFFVLFLVFHKPHGNSVFLFHEVIVQVFGQYIGCPY